jgi:predicted metal-dependent phosphoesterase TrpH
VPAPRFDLQSHSTCSDGALPPAEVVALAAQAGVELLALTDHDTVEGVAEALEAGARHGVKVVPAAEISAVHEGAEDLHVLGYGLDHEDPELLARLRTARDDRAIRAERMTARLRELGLAVDDEALAALRAAGRPLGRPHLAAAAFTPPENAERLEAEGIGDASALLVAYLIPGAPAYLPRARPTGTEAIGWIHDAGGVAVWAHPFWDIEDGPEVLAAIESFAAAGLDGVEAFYPTHTAEQTRLVAGRCAELGLLTTGSSDFHGPSHRFFSRFLVHDLHGLEPDLGRIAG